MVEGQRIPLVRWSMLNMFLRAGHLNRSGQFGDGREQALVEHVVSHTRAGDIDDVIAGIDWFAYHRSWLFNIGDEKGQLLDDAVRRSESRLAVELGTYCGYSALRIARAAPSTVVFSVEQFLGNAAVARHIWAHAGVSDRITCVIGRIADGGHTLDLLQQCGLGPGIVDFLLLDHDKSAYVADLCSIVERGWLHPGSVVLADNVKTPGAPEYLAYMRDRQGQDWQTVEHETHLEYQTWINDVVLESVSLAQKPDPAQLQAAPIRRRTASPCSSQSHP
jgi:catechol O-methyltransferase